MIKSRIFLKLQALVLVICLLPSSGGWAFPEAGISINPQTEVPAFFKIDIPKDLAAVDEIYSAPPKLDPRLILHIQNIHGHYEAQVQIKKLLQYLHDKYGFSLIFAEGAVEKLNPEYLELFDEKEKNLALADLLAKQGDLTGVEYYLMDRPKDVEALGIEKAELYRKNFKAFKEVYHSKKETDRFLEQYEQKLEKLSSVIFSPELRKMLAEWKKFGSGHREFLPYVKSLSEEAKKNTGIDLQSLFAQVEWPQLTRLLVIQSMEIDMNKEAAEKEKAALMKFLKEKGIPERIIHAIETVGERQIQMNRMMAGDSGEDVPRDLFEQLVAEAGPKGFRFSDYPAFSLWAGYVILQSELDAKTLFAEIEKLFDKILNELASTEKQKNLLELYRDSDLLRKAFALELSRDEWDRTVYRKEWIQPKVMVRRLTVIASDRRERSNLQGLRNPSPAAPPRNDDHLSDLLNKATQSDAVRPAYQPSKLSRVSSFSPPQHPKSLTDVFNVAYRFYELARERETVFYETIEREMTKRKSEKAILVTGGFHTDGLMDIFREQEVSYSVLTPRISDKGDRSQYVSSMLENKPTLFDLAQLEGVVGMQRSEVRKAQGADHSLIVMDVFLRMLSETPRSEVRRGLANFDRTLFAQNNRFSMTPGAQPNVYHLSGPEINDQITFNGGISLKKESSKSVRSELRAKKSNPKKEFDYQMGTIQSAYASEEDKIRAIGSASYLLGMALKEKPKSALALEATNAMSVFFEGLQTQGKTELRDAFLLAVTKFFWSFSSQRQNEILKRIKEKLYASSVPNLVTIAMAAESITRDPGKEVLSIEILETFAGFLAFHPQAEMYSILYMLNQGDLQDLKKIQGLPKNLQKISRFSSRNTSLFLDVGADPLLRKMGYPVPQKKQPKRQPKQNFHLSPEQIRRFYSQIKKKGMLPDVLLENYFAKGKIVLWGSNNPENVPRIMRDIKELAAKDVPIFLALPYPPDLADAFKEFIQKKGGDAFKDYLVNILESDEEEITLLQEHYSELPPTTQFGFYGADPGLSPESRELQKVYQLTELIKATSNQNLLVLGAAENWMKTFFQQRRKGQAEKEIGLKIKEHLPVELAQKLVFILEEFEKDWRIDAFLGFPLHNLMDLRKMGFYLQDFALEFGGTLIDDRPFYRNYFNPDGSLIRLIQSHDALVFRSENNDRKPDFFERPVLPRPRRKTPPRTPVLVRSEIRKNIRDIKRILVLDDEEDIHRSGREKRRKSRSEMRAREFSLASINTIQPGEGLIFESDSLFMISVGSGTPELIQLIDGKLFNIDSTMHQEVMGDEWSRDVEIRDGNRTTLSRKPYNMTVSNNGRITIANESEDQITVRPLRKNAPRSELRDSNGLGIVNPVSQKNFATRADAFSNLQTGPALRLLQKETGRSMSPAQQVFIVAGKILDPQADAAQMELTFHFVAELESGKISESLKEAQSIMSELSQTASDAPGSLVIVTRELTLADWKAIELELGDKNQMVYALQISENPALLASKSGQFFDKLSASLQKNGVSIGKPGERFLYRVVRPSEVNSALRDMASQIYRSRKVINPNEKIPAENYFTVLAIGVDTIDRDTLPGTVIQASGEKEYARSEIRLAQAIVAAAVSKGRPLAEEIKRSLDYEQGRPFRINYSGLMTWLKSVGTKIAALLKIRSSA